ncbi:FecR family protein [Segetibacter sp. 3557_3]|uniref:FecR family protein n=1 Tax=Segetibacter sp. 3557_3 TaxID=2547429 RepID=UPI001058F0E1|nr:FecR domain-containing protein [Segetibacter sp. 3557_3]TDH20690.1 FecR family protein [Segetibacter sp. 3557_3]
MEPNPPKDLLERYLSGTASAAEVAVVERWYEQQEDVSLDDQNKDLIGAALYQQIIRSPAFSPAPVHRIHYLKSNWFRYAAVLLIAATALIVYLAQREPEQRIVQQSTTNPANILPGGNKAVLILADGSSISLESAADGNLTAQGKTAVVKLKTGMLKYTAAKEGVENTEVSYNTLRTPKGGQYQVELPDGTMVWLNAASSIRFPTLFPGNDRTVEITGEAYFEVAPDKAKPFVVSAGAMQVQVLGTHFNINAYTEENTTTTTLIKGRVAILHGSNRDDLTPGQQARFNDANNLTIVNHADLEQVVAWKNGFTAFKSADIKSIMRQVARWYDVEVRYEGAIPDRRFSGEISRTVNLSQLLRILQAGGIRFTVEGRKLIVKS